MLSALGGPQAEPQPTLVKEEEGIKGMKTLMNETGRIANLNLVALAVVLVLGLAAGPA